MLTLVAVVFNTSRFGIFSILITDLILFYIQSKHKKMLVKLAVIILIISSFSILPSIIEAWNVYFEPVDNLTLRSSIYKRTYEYFFGQNIATKILGTGSENFLSALTIICPETLSSESEFVSQLVFSGILGLCIFMGFLGMNLLHAVRCYGYKRLMGLLLVLNMILVSVTSDLLFIVSIYPIVILCAVANSTINQSLHEPEVMLHG
jgi:O-antigen ligase